MKIEEQQSVSPTTPQAAAGLISTMAPQQRNSSDGVLLGFQEMFQQSMNDELASVSPGSKRKADDFLGQQQSDPFTTNQINRVEPTNATGPDDWQYEFNSTIASLNAKHGAIDKDCSLTSKWMIKLNLFGIWALLKQLEKKKLEELDISSLAPYYNIIQDAEKQNFNVKWLHDRLDDIRVAVVARYEATRLEATKSKHIKERKEMESKLSWLQTQVQKLEGQVAGKDLEIEDLTGEINNETAKFQHFETTPLLDGLI